MTKTGIQIFLPKIPEEKDTKKLSFFRYIKKDKLTKNRFGIFEPSKNENPSDIIDLDLILVPFRAVNKNLYRLGYGGGFYDCSLSGINSNKCLGLGYDFQILDEFDIEPHDFKLGKLITPEGYFKNALKPAFSETLVKGYSVFNKSLLSLFNCESFIENPTKAPP